MLGNICKLGEGLEHIVKTILITFEKKPNITECNNHRTIIYYHLQQKSCEKL